MSAPTSPTPVITPAGARAVELAAEHDRLLTERQTWIARMERAMASEHWRAMRAASREVAIRTLRLDEIKRELGLSWDDGSDEDIKF